MGYPRERVFDMGKLTFGSLVLGAMLRGEIEVTRIFLFGVSAAALLFIVGAILILNSGE
ncbi:hypothetical protein AGMMS4952_18350 [Spirochaetia bacterium]|nr:hypothetical protein AGMMS4952_18350 [Spirochaetia bacterium]